MKKTGGHEERAHSKFSASGAERWFHCPGSVDLSEGMPDKPSPWAEEGTKAHEVLESILKVMIQVGSTKIFPPQMNQNIPRDMIAYGTHAANFIMGLFAKTPGSDIMVETRIYLDFIHPEMFGTFDGAVVDHFGTLHVFDYKYGAGHFVSPVENLQMIFYGIGLAHKFNWNFKRVRLWIIQPRVKGYDGPLFWEIDTSTLKHYVKDFNIAVNYVLRNPEVYTEGSWCHWCKAKSVCPLKEKRKIESAKHIFKPVKKGIDYGEQEESEVESDKEENGKEIKNKTRGQKEGRRKERKKENGTNRGEDNFY